MHRPRYMPDNFMLMILGTVILASFLPSKGEMTKILGILTYGAIAVLFFLHGAKLERQAVLAGLTHWRLHALIFFSTFVAFPIIGILLRPILLPLVTPALYMGILFLCTLPATIQSSIAFTSVARGNVAAAVCSASASSILGIFITPLLASFILTMDRHAKTLPLWHGILDITLQLLLPFILGQIARRSVASWIDGHRSALTRYDQGTILLIIYSAFSAAVVQGLWKQIPAQALLGLFVACAILLTVVLLFTCTMSRWLGFKKEDEIAIVFCGSKKGLATGVLIANVLFPAPLVGPILLPLMLFHQIQLMTCAYLARTYAKRPIIQESA